MACLWNSAVSSGHYITSAVCVPEEVSARFETAVNSGNIEQIIPRNNPVELYISYTQSYSLTAVRAKAEGFARMDMNSHLFAFISVSVFTPLMKFT